MMKLYFKKNFYRPILMAGAIVGSTLFLNGCYKDNAEYLYPGPVGGTACDTLAMKYSSNVSPILNKYCAYSGCHTTADKASAGGYALDSYTETMVSVNNGKLSKSINHVSGTSQMPKGGAKLNDCDINKIDAWIHQGAAQ